MKVIVYIFLLLVLGGCTNHFKALYATVSATDARVVKDTEYDQGLRNHIDKLKKGPVVDGSDCLVHYPFMRAKALEDSEKVALREAIDKAGQPYNGLAYVNVTWTIYPLPITWSCFDVNGTAAIDEPYIARK